MKVTTKKISHTEERVVEVCCKSMQGQLDFYHSDVYSTHDGKITCDGVYIYYCPFCGKKIDYK